MESVDEEISVAIDVRSITEKPTGIGIYVKNLIPFLAEIDNLTIYLFCTKATPRSEIQGVQWVELPTGVFFYPSALRKIRSLKIDVFHSPFSGIIPLILGKKSIITIHDLVPQLFPKTTTLSSRISFYITQIAAKRSGSLVVVSESTAKDVTSHWNVKTPVYVTRPGINRFPKPSEISKFPAKSEYFLSVSTLEPRKNLSTLITAYIGALNRNTDIPDLLICGGEGWRGEGDKLRNLAEASNGKIKFLGYVPDEELNFLISKCKAFFFPSMYEGVGLPPMEAALQGAPVICSNIPSISELLKGIACLISPDDLESWENAFIRASNDVEWLNILAQNNTSLTSISHRNTALETHRAYIRTKNSINRLSSK